MNNTIMKIHKAQILDQRVRDIGTSYSQRGLALESSRYTNTAEKRVLPL